MIKNAYIAINPKTRQVVGACLVDANDNLGIAEFIADGFILDRVTADKARELFLRQLPDDWEV